MRNHLMIDLETLSLEKNATIIQIGAVAFDPDGVNLIDKREWTVNSMGCLMIGSHTDPGTINWWKEQSPEAQAAVSAAAVPIRTAMRALTEFCVEADAGHGVWSHGASFDLPIIEWYAARLGIVLPWSYRAHRDTRTLFWVARAAGWVPEKREGVAHTAGDDALAQAREVCSAIQFLKATAPVLAQAVQLGVQNATPGDWDQMIA